MLRAEISGVIEIHVYQAKFHDGAGNLGAEAERDALIRLDVNDETIGLKISYAGIAKQDEGRAAELNHDFGFALRQALAGAQIKGNTGPAPIIDLELQGHERFSVRIAGHVRLAAIADDALVVNYAFAVLAANHAGKDFLRPERLDGVKDFCLFVTDFVGIEGNGRLHGRHGQ